MEINICQISVRDLIECREQAGQIGQAQRDVAGHGH